MRGFLRNGRWDEKHARSRNVIGRAPFDFDSYRWAAADDGRGRVIQLNFKVIHELVVRDAAPWKQFLTSMQASRKMVNISL